MIVVLKSSKELNIIIRKGVVGVFIFCLLFKLFVLWNIRCVGKKKVFVSWNYIRFLIKIKYNFLLEVCIMDE